MGTVELGVREGDFLDILRWDLGGLKTFSGIYKNWCQESFRKKALKAYSHTLNIVSICYSAKSFLFSFT